MNHEGGPDAGGTQPSRLADFVRADNALSKGVVKDWGHFMASITPPGTEASGHSGAAGLVAREAALKAGVTVESVNRRHDLGEVAQLFETVWAGSSLMPATFLRALSHSGNYVGAAYDQGHVIGALVGFLGMYEARPVLHSHMLAVLPSARGRQVGFALKLHQREWALERRLQGITWTFDPLVSRNAYLNLNQLGAEGIEYLVNFYGVMRDSINSGEESDRLLAVWRIATRHVGDVIAGRSPSESISGGRATILAPGPHGEPVLTPATTEVLLCTIPRDIATIRREDATLARAWRLALRRTLGGAMADGYRAATFTKDGSYILAHS
jgi:predicted GNAT superfamily acetyltransferase